MIFEITMEKIVATAAALSFRSLGPSTVRKITFTATKASTPHINILLREHLCHTFTTHTLAVSGVLA